MAPQVALPVPGRITHGQAPAAAGALLTLAALAGATRTSFGPRLGDVALRSASS